MESLLYTLLLFGVTISVRCEVLRGTEPPNAILLDINSVDTEVTDLPFSHESDEDTTEISLAFYSTEETHINDVQTLRDWRVQVRREFIRFREVHLSNSGGIAKASSVHPSGLTPTKAFESGYWHSNSPYTAPQSLWVEFPEPMNIVMYSFTSRPEFEYITTDGPSKYIFWASNHNDCTKESHWIILKKDTSGKPFDKSNYPKTEIVDNSNFYRCYGFKVLDVPGRGIKPVTIGNVHFYSLRELCPSPFKFRGGECFFVYKDETPDRSESLTWEEARQRCLGMGADLAQPKDIVDFIEYIKTDHPRAKPTIWLGAHDTEEEQVWRWVGSGDPVPPTVWRHSKDAQPSGDGNCMEIHHWPHTGFYLNDWFCDKKGNFACEFDIEMI